MQRQNLHKAIEEDNFEIVQHFVDSHQTVIIGYNDGNIPALFSSLNQAMKTNSFKIYAYLLSKGFVADNNCDFIKLQKERNEDQKEDITNKIK